MLNRQALTVASLGIVLWCCPAAESTWVYRQGQGLQNETQFSRDNLRKRCQEELRLLDGKGCYRWAMNPPSWAKPQGKNSPSIEPFLYQYALEQAIERDPNLAAAYLALGGLPRINKAIELLPHFAGGYRHRGDYYLAHDEHKLAEADFSKTIELVDGKQAHRLEVDGMVYELDPDEHLASMYRYRALARLLQGKHEQISSDMDKALAEVKKKDPVMGSYYLLQLAWIASVHPDAKIRNAEFARKLIAQAEDYENN